ncbi:MAG TPA: hypothetical protein VMP68_12540, partial [Candidatus Eisenbacteria bacterium]|nr:hypothetical protein [Candidatus Eisenbacteria bacterium]
MDDHSDWWSILNEHSRGPRIKPSGHDLDARNFEIAKLDLAKVSFADIAARLGRAARIRRGDASSSREQACYVSAHGSMPTYLIFEFGEDVSNFYLFADGEGWKGRSSCAKSEQLSSDTSTFSGLRLGLTLEQFKAILGQPDSTADSELVYSRAVKTKSTPEQFERQRKEYPDALSDRVAHEKFDFYTVSLYIEGRFTDSKLSYL